MRSKVSVCAANASRERGERNGDNGILEHRNSVLVYSKPRKVDCCPNQAPRACIWVQDMGRPSATCMTISVRPRITSVERLSPSTSHHDVSVMSSDCQKQDRASFQCWPIVVNPSTSPPFLAPRSHGCSKMFLKRAKSRCSSIPVSNFSPMMAREYCL